MAVVRLAWRRLVAAPLFFSTAVFSIAAGIGTVGGVHAILSSLSYDRGAARSNRLNLYHRDPRITPRRSAYSFSKADFERLRNRQQSFSSVHAWAPFSGTLTLRRHSEAVSGELLDGALFDRFSASPILGRPILPSDDEPGAPLVVVLGHSVWRRLGAHEDIVGSSVRLNDQVAEIVGVMGPLFRGIGMPMLERPMVWVPLVWAERVTRRASEVEARWLRVVAWLRPGVSIQHAAAELTFIGRQLDAEDPIGNGLVERYRSPDKVSRRWMLVPASAIRIHESVHRLVGPAMFVMMCAAGLVLFVACFNVTLLGAARRSMRQRDIMTSIALGAPRYRLIWDEAAEAAMVCLIAGVLGGILAAASTGILPASGIPVGEDAILHVEAGLQGSMHVIGITTLISFVIAGIIPSVRFNASYSPPSERSISNAASGSRRRRVIAGLQVGVAALLIGLNVLLAQGVAALGRHAGMDLRRMAFLEIDLGKSSDAQERRLLAGRVREAVAQLDVSSVSMSTGLPVEVGSEMVEVGPVDGVLDGTAPGPPAVARLIFVDSTFFETTGIDVVHGRGFQPRDLVPGARAAVVSEKLAQSVFGLKGAIGQTIRIQRYSEAGVRPGREALASIIGIAADTDTGQIGRRDISGGLYLPLTEYPETIVTVVRAAREGDEVASAMRSRVAMIDAKLVGQDATSGRALLESRTLYVRTAAVVSGALGLLALLLAMTGVYGVMSHTTAARTHEFGIRAALGADRRAVRRLVLVQGLRPVAAGVVGGFAMAFWAYIAFGSSFVAADGIDDYLMTALSVLGLLAVTTAACWIPARRATRVSPLTAMKWP